MRFQLYQVFFLLAVYSILYIYFLPFIIVLKKNKRTLIKISLPCKLLNLSLKNKHFAMYVTFQAFFGNMK